MQFYSSVLKYFLSELFLLVVCVALLTEAERKSEFCEPYGDALKCMQHMLTEVRTKFTLK